MSRQNHYYRNASAFLREGVQLREDAREAEAKRGRDNRKAGRGKALWADMVAEKDKIFDALKVGDTLDAFGVPSVVAKKNAKSVITGTGVKFTRKELTG